MADDRALITATANVAIGAIERLIESLRQANDCLVLGNHNGAIGSLLTFDDDADDLRAALRLYRSATRRMS